MKEYGGYLEFEHYNGAEYHSNCIKLNSARNCLRLLIREKNISKIYLPYYICDSVIEACEKEGILIDYYHIDNNLFPVFDCDLGEKEYLYVVNYYGLLNEEYLMDIHKKYNNLILDNVQAFFIKPFDNIDTIYSCRKYFGVSDGAYLYTNMSFNDNIELDKSFNRMLYLFGRYEEGAQAFYDLYQKNEESLYNENIKRMSKLTENILRSIDYELILKRRNSNFKILCDNLGSINLLSVGKLNGAYMYPLLVNNGSVIRNELIKRNIYIPKLWPNIGDNERYEFYLSENILNIPCDQRYNEDDMLYIVKIIKEIGEII